ncbi:hypothetical protein LTR84_011181 [Exophiala bonariae]|uniref:Low temperature requirement A n=1 Tax=Exophiala bonariae TaxID=1690606 RepID=A0AAV9NJH0_9EURO|nr:hypothetical protein LTR84_011181 [Exophiala bonariae]
MHIGQVLDRGISTGPRFRKHTPWITSPLTNTTNAHNHTGQPSAETSASDLIADQAMGRRRQGVPQFQQRHESTTIELFYDLFFVANLSSFSNNHEIVDAKTLRNYIGFFTILWFTWLQTSLFDVRFAADSCFDRVCKAFSFAIMTGFAMVGVLYDTTNVEGNSRIFQIMSLILMSSRLILIVQYGVVFIYVRQYHNTRTPLLATMGALFVAAAIFLGTYWGFNVTESTNHDGVEVVKLAHPDIYLAWYIVAVLEAAPMGPCADGMLFSVALSNLVENIPDSVNTTLGLAQYLEDGINTIDGWNKQSQLAQFYDYNYNLTSLRNITITPYNSTQWWDEADPILSDLVNGVATAIFNQFGVEGPETHDHSVHETLQQKTEALKNVFGTVFVYFYIAAGSFLLVLATLYWFGKTQKSLGEWLSILLRSLVGIGIGLLCLFSFSDTDAADAFILSTWQIGVVVIAYFIGKSQCM